MGKVNFRIPDPEEVRLKREAQDAGLTFTQYMHKKLGIKLEPSETPEKKVWKGAGYVERTEEPNSTIPLATEPPKGDPNAGLPDWAVRLINETTT